jgi:hypothetical protein
VCELAVGGVATVACPFIPVLAERSTLSASALLLPFAFALAVAVTLPASLGVPTLLPKPFRSVLVNFSFLSSAGRISGVVSFHSTAVTALISWAELIVPVHDGEAWGVLSFPLSYSFLPCAFTQAARH